MKAVNVEFLRAGIEKILRIETLIREIMKALQITVDYLDRTVTLNSGGADKVMKKIKTLDDLRGLPWKVKLKKQKAAKQLEPDLVKILDGFSTLQLTNDDDPKNVDFWESHLSLMSMYFKKEYDLKRWLTKTLSAIDFWQKQNSERQSRTPKGLRARIDRWLRKEYSNLETGKR